MTDWLKPLRDAAEGAEEWRDVPGHEGRYQVSSLGRVRSLTKAWREGGRILAQSMSRDGYLRVGILCRTTRVHRLVAMAFLPGDHSLQVNHKNCDKADNRPENLEWVSQLDNMRHAWANNIFQRGADKTSAKLTEADVVDIRGLVASGKSMNSVASQYGVSFTTVKKIVSGRTWRHVPLAALRRHLEGGR